METMLDRLAGAMKTLSKREGKALTPRQRVAAAQRWNSLADIGEDRLDKYRDTFGEDFLARDRRHAVKNGLDNADYGDELWGLMDLGLVGKRGQRADNPFLSDNIDKYAEQSDFLDWCRHWGLEPNGRNLKTFRWERYKEMSVPQRESIYYNYDNRFLPEERMWRSRSDMPDYLPVGWDDISNRREADLAEERARQAYNRKVAAWNSYQDLPYRQRQWIANEEAIKSYLGPEMYGYPEDELSGIKTLNELEDYLQKVHPEDDWPKRYPMYDSPVFESFEDFPDELSDAPWRTR